MSWKICCFHPHNWRHYFKKVFKFFLNLILDTSEANQLETPPSPSSGMNSAPRRAFQRFLMDSLTPNCLFEASPVSKVYSELKPSVVVPGTNAWPQDPQDTWVSQADRAPLLPAPLPQLLPSSSTFLSKRVPCVLQGMFTSDEGCGGTD